MPRGLDPLYFNRRRSLDGALAWSGLRKPVSLCIDVGANVGQTMRSFLEWWPTTRCVSFEPLPAVRKVLFEEVARTGGRAVAYDSAISDRAGSCVLHASRSSSVSSSLHRFNKSSDTVSAHRGLRDSLSFLERSDSEDTYEVRVDSTTLDDHFAETTGPDREWIRGGVDILKSDTQGHDLQVLRGANRVLQSTRVVLVEWQFDDVYGRPKPISELDSYLAKHAFRFWDVAHIYKDLTTLRTLWADLIYAKQAVASSG